MSDHRPAASRDPGTYTGHRPTTPEAPRYDFTATPATRAAVLLRAAFCGAGGSGKTWTALLVACFIATRLNLGKVFLVDSESGSALKYAKSKRSGRGFDFVHVPLPRDDNSPEAYAAAIDFCEAEGAKIIVIDSVSHEWDGPRGVLELVDIITNEAGKKAEEKAARQGWNAPQEKGSFSSGWKEMKPRHWRFIQHMLRSKAHILMTVRAAVKHDVLKDGKGRTKIGEAYEGPVQQKEFRYEPDIWFHMEQLQRRTDRGEDETLTDACVTVTKSRCDVLPMGAFFREPGEDLGALLAEWMEDCEPAPVTSSPADIALDVAARATEATKVQVTEMMAIARRLPEPHRHMAVSSLLARLYVLAPTVAAVLGMAKYAHDCGATAGFVREWEDRRRAELEAAPVTSPHAASDPPADPTAAVPAMIIREAKVITEAARALAAARQQFGDNEALLQAFAERVKLAADAAAEARDEAALVAVEALVKQAALPRGSAALAFAQNALEMARADMAEGA